VEEQPSVPRIWDVIDVLVVAAIVWWLAHSDGAADSLLSRGFFAVVAVSVVGWAVRRVVTRLGGGRVIEVEPRTSPKTWTDAEVELVRVNATYQVIDREALLVGGAVVSAIAAGAADWWALLGLLAPAGLEWRNRRLRRNARAYAAASRRHAALTRAPD
jgi:hypothetical protein